MNVTDSIHRKRNSCEVQADLAHSAASLVPLLFFRGASALFSTGARNFPV
jgi:hypothetical protein